MEYVLKAVEIRIGRMHTVQSKKFATTVAVSMHMHATSHNHLPRVLGIYGNEVG